MTCNAGGGEGEEKGDPSLLLSDFPWGGPLSRGKEKKKKKKKKKSQLVIGPALFSPKGKGGKELPFFVGPGGRRGGETGLPSTGTPRPIGEEKREEEDR